MKILPITTNNIQNKQITSKGGVSAEIEGMLKEIASSCRDNAQYQSLYNRNAASSYLKYAETADNIISNLNSIMLQYPVGSILKAKQSNKNPQKFRFYIEAFASYYKHIIGDINLSSRDYSGNIEGMTKLTDKMAKDNPYETNLKFKMFEKKPNSEIEKFLPEKENIMIEDKLKEYNI